MHKYRTARMGQQTVCTQCFDVDLAIFEAMERRSHIGVKLAKT